MATTLVATMSPSSSDPFLSSHLAEDSAPLLSSRPKLKLRPASMVLPPMPTFTAPSMHDTPMATTSGATTALPSPAPFVGTSMQAGQWASTGPVIPPSPLMPPSLAYGGLAGKEMPRSPLSPLRQVNEEDYGFPAVPSSSMVRSSTSDRLSPYSLADRKVSSGDRRTAAQRSKLQQLFGKGLEMSKEKSPAGFPFPSTPPLTPTYSNSSEAGSPRLSPLFTPLSTLQNANFTTPPTPPVSAGSPVVAEGDVSTKALANHVLHPRFAREYRILGELGSGGFGFVVRAIRLSDKRIVAVKFISIAKVPSHAWVKIPNWDGGNQDGTRGGEACIPMEAFVLRRVQHDGVVSFIDLFRQGPYFYLVMEHHGSPWVAPDKEKHLTSPSTMPALVAAAKEAEESAMQIDDSTPLSSSPTPMSRFNGPPSPPHAAPPMLRRASCDLFECIEQHKRLPEATARFVFFQVCDAVRHLLKLGICHRDIKDENIVIDKNYRVKLIDFGSAVIHDPRSPPPFHNRFWGTMNFASAEILASQPYQAPQAEVWALGVLLCLLVLGETPFSSMDRAREGRPSVNFSSISRDCCDLIMRCLVVNPNERITIDGVLSHPWLCPPSPPLTSHSPPRMTRAATLA